MKLKLAEEPLALGRCPETSKGGVATTTQQKVLPLTKIRNGRSQVPDLLIKPATADHPVGDSWEFLLERAKGLRDTLQVVRDAERCCFLQIEARDDGRCARHITSVDNHPGSVLVHVSRAVHVSGFDDGRERSDQLREHPRSVSPFYTGGASSLIQSYKNCRRGRNGRHSFPIEQVGHACPPVPPRPQPLPNFHAARPPVARPPYVIGFAA